MSYTAVNMTVPLRPDAPGEVLGFLRERVSMEGYEAWLGSRPRVTLVGGHNPPIPGGGVPRALAGPVTIELHGFFQAPRWAHLLSPLGGTGCHFDAERRVGNEVRPVSWLEDVEGMPGPVLCLRSALKDYDDEIDLFLDWVSHYAIPYQDGTVVGVSGSDHGLMSDVAWQDGRMARLNWRDGDLREDEALLKRWPLPDPGLAAGRWATDMGAGRGPALLR